MTNNDLMLQMTGKERKEYENWKAERLKIDEERIARQLTSSGSWKREWDLNKVEEDKEITQKTENVYYKQPRWLTDTGNNQVGRGNQNSFNPIIVESSNEIDIKNNKERSVVLNENNSLTIVKNSEVKEGSFGSKRHEDLQKSQDGKWQYERKNTFAENEEKTYAKRESWKQDNGKKTNFKITAKGDSWDILPPSQNKNEKKWKQNESSCNYDYSNCSEEGKKFIQKNNENWESTENDKKKQLNVWNSDSQENKFHGRKYKFSSNQENFEEISSNRCIDGMKFEFRESERQWNRTKKYSDGWDEDGWTKSKDNRIRNEGNWNRSKDSWTRKASDGWESYNSGSLNEYKNKHSEKSRGTNFRGNKKNYNSGISGKLKSNKSGWYEEEKYENNGWCVEEKYENTNQKKSSFVWENNLNRREKSEGFDDKTSNEYNWDFKKRNDRKQNFGGKRFRENQSYKSNQPKNFSLQRNKGEFRKKNSESISENYLADECHIDTSVPVINDGWECDNIINSNTVESKGEWEIQPDGDINNDSVNSCDQWISNSGFETENIESKAIITEGENHDDSWEDVTTSGCESLELSGPNDEINSKVKDDIEVDLEQNLIKNSFVGVYDENESNVEIDEYKQVKGAHLEEIVKISDLNENSEPYEISIGQKNPNVNIEQTSENKEEYQLNSEQINEMINIEIKENGNNSENVFNSKSKHKNFLIEENVSESIENSSRLLSDNIDFQENSEDSCTFLSSNLLDISVSNSDDRNTECEILSSEYSNKKYNSINQTNRDCDISQISEIYEVKTELNNNHLRENDNSEVKEIIDSFENKEEIISENHKNIELIKENHTELKQFEDEENKTEEIFEEKSESFGKEIKESCTIIEENCKKLDKMKYEINEDKNKEEIIESNENNIKENEYPLVKKDDAEDKNEEIIESNENYDIKENEYPVIKEVNENDKVESERNQENSNEMFEYKMIEELEIENKENLKTNQNNIIKLEECEMVKKIENDDKIFSKGNSDEIFEESELYNKFEYEDKVTNFKQNYDIKEKEDECIKESDDDDDKEINTNKNSNAVEKEKNIESEENLDIEEEKHEINQFENDQTEKEAIRYKETNDKIEEKEHKLMKKLDSDDKEKLELNKNYDDKMFEENKPKIVKYEDKENMLFIEESKENNRVESDIVEKSDGIVSVQNSYNSSVISEKLDQETKEAENIENSNLNIEKDLIIKYNENNSTIQEIRTFTSITDSGQPLITETNLISQENSNIDKQDRCLSQHVNQTEQLMENEENSDHHLNQRTVRKALATESITEFTEVLEVTASVPLRSAMQEIEKTSNMSSVESKINLDCKDDIFKVAE